MEINTLKLLKADLLNATAKRQDAYYARFVWS